MTMSDRICLMNEARIEQVASPSELYFSPRTVFGAGFVGESNRYDGVVQAVEGGRAVVQLPFGCVNGRMMSVAGPGDHCTVMIRPEAVGVTANGAAAAGNALVGEVISHVIAGAIGRTYVRMADGQVLVATSLTRRNGNSANGRVQASFQPEDTLVYGSAS